MPTTNNKRRQKEAKRRNGESGKDDREKQDKFPEHLSHSECDKLYLDKKLIRGTLRSVNKSTAFVACDRGSLLDDILIPDEMHRNRALHGDTVFVELLVNSDEDPFGDQVTEKSNQDDQKGLDSAPTDAETWQNDDMQMALWNPQITIERPKIAEAPAEAEQKLSSRKQSRGKVVHVVHPNQAPLLSELNPNKVDVLKCKRTIVGTLKFLNERIVVLTPCNAKLVQFKCSESDVKKLKEKVVDKDWDHVLVTATYTYGSWKAHQVQWPPCTNLQVLGDSFVVEHQIEALLETYEVNHGADFNGDVLRDVEEAVASGLQGGGSWEPTPSMCEGRRDYRKSRRVFTIDPTTAKDLDDALHIMEHEDGTIEVGVHIADVSHFVRPGSDVDKEAIRRGTTVYLVDRTIPMLPRMLCEVACSLNENVDRLAFSCVWRMNRDGTLVKDIPIWYGRTVIRSCARLDYATAQNIIDASIPTWSGDQWEAVDWWLPSRRPSAPHALSDVAADVRLMHAVAMSRRRLRFENGALALHAVKLTFELEDNESPMLAAPYPIRDSNRVVEEFMLLANYFTAQRLVTHAGGRAVLRRHPEPIMDSLHQAAEFVSASVQFQLDISTSQALQRSLQELSRFCEDDPLIIQCVTQMLMMPMQAAVYFSSATEPRTNWHHYALNMPYYTHFTVSGQIAYNRLLTSSTPFVLQSPIRRYPDILVHRLLEATLDETIESQPDSGQLQRLCEHCSEKQIASKEAQARCDRVFLSLYTQRHPIPHQMGVVVSVGKKAFTVFVPRLGCEGLLYLEEHKNVLSWTTNSEEDAAVEGKRIFLHSKNGATWKHLKVEVFAKLQVTVVCKEKTPIDIKMRFEGLWTEDEPL